MPQEILNKVTISRSCDMESCWKPLYFDLTPFASSVNVYSVQNVWKNQQSHKRKKLVENEYSLNSYQTS